MADRNKLPPKARAKIFTLADQEAAAFTALNSNQRQIAELAKSYDLVSDESRKRELKEESDRRQQVQETLRERHRAFADLNGKVRRYLDLLPADAVLEDAKVPRIKLKAGETHQQLVAGLRIKIVKLIGERSQVERAALPKAEIKAQLKKWLTERGLRSAPRVIANHDKFEVKFDARIEDAFTSTVDVMALLAWFDPEHVEKKLMALIDAMPKAHLAMTPSEKAERLAAIKVELGDAERLECALIDDALDNGVLIDVRANISIPALLGLVVTRKSEARAA